MVKPRRIRKMVQSLFSRLPSIRGRRKSAPTTSLETYNRSIANNALSAAVVGGLTYQSYRELIREGQEMQLKTTMNLMSLMESLQSISNQPSQNDPVLVDDILKLCGSITHACTTVLGKLLSTERTVCYRDLHMGYLIQKIQSEPNFLERRTSLHDEVQWTAHYNPVAGLLLYSGKRIVGSSTLRPIEYIYTFMFEYPFPFTHDRMVFTLTNLVNCFRNEFDNGPWTRATQNQLRELESKLGEADCVPEEPIPTNSSVSS